MTNYKTTLAGVGAMLTAIGYALKAVFDNDPTTNLDISQLVLAFTAGVGLLHAKDASSDK
jgi:hypothetical protein